MIDLYFWRTPNGLKITVMLEECGLGYRLVPVNIGQGEQFAPEFLKISPGNRIPAITDHDPPAGPGPFSLFESGAILLYLAEKTGRFLPADPRKRGETLAWLFWQVGSLGPMCGQNHHFSRYAAEKIPYAIDRYVRETARLYRVLDHRLSQSPWVGGDDYGIADMACMPWIVSHREQGQDLEKFPALRQWYGRVRERPAVIRGMSAGEELPPAVTDAASREILFGRSGGQPGPDGS